MRDQTLSPPHSNTFPIKCGQFEDGGTKKRGSPPHPTGEVTPGLLSESTSNPSSAVPVTAPTGSGFYSRSWLPLSLCLADMPACHRVASIMIFKWRWKTLTFSNVLGCLELGKTPHCKLWSSPVPRPRVKRCILFRIRQHRGQVPRAEARSLLQKPSVYAFKWLPSSGLQLFIGAPGASRCHRPAAMKWNLRVCVHMVAEFITFWLLPSPATAFPPSRARGGAA